ncbi:MAG: hypothetical protein ACTSUN_10240 [Promethearchaeota archaeon]
MKRNKVILINLIFLAIFLISLIISLTYGVLFSFFFLPLFCFLPFTWRSKPRTWINEEEDQYQVPSIQVKRCPVCGGVIKEGIDAKYCYHCGAKIKHY